MNVRQQQSTLAGRADYTTCHYSTTSKCTVEAEECTHGHIVVAAAEALTLPSAVQKQGCLPYALCTEHHAECSPQGGGKLTT